MAMNQALLMSYTIGSLLGPTLTATLMQNFSDNLLFIMIASVSFIYLLTLLRKAGHHQRRWRTPDPVTRSACCASSASITYVYCCRTNLSLCMRRQWLDGYGFPRRCRPA